MSRNFDLIHEIEHERELLTSSSEPRVSIDRSAVQEAASFDEGNLGGEEMARLIQSVFLPAHKPAPRKVVFCGVDEESGSSSVCAKAGRILASRSAKSVCIVDANLRRSRVSRILGVETTIRISKRPSSDPEQCGHIGGSLWLAGTDHLMDASGSPLQELELEHRLAHLGNQFEYLLIDAPGLAVSNDAALLGRNADATILVVEAGSTRRTSAAMAKAALDAAGVKLTGTVLHNWKFPISETLYKRL